MCGNLNNLGRVYTDTKHELFVEDGNKLQTNIFSRIRNK